MRDRADNVVVVCSIENLDPMGVHTGDSITVAPGDDADRPRVPALRDIGIAIIREVGVDTGGCNIQFAVNPADGRDHRHRDEPAGLALQRAGVEGHRLPDREDRGQARHRLHPGRDPQRHHRKTPASFEPTLDYVVVKVPRFAFEKFPAADPTLTTTMKSSARRWRSAAASPRRCRRRCGRWRQRGAQFRLGRRAPPDADELAALLEQMRRPTAAASASAARRAGRRDDRAAARGDRDRPVVPRPDRPDRRGRPLGRRRRGADADLLREAKRHGFSDAQIGRLRGMQRGRRARRCGTPSASARSTRRSTPAPPSSPPPRRTTTPATTRRTEVDAVSERRKVIILGVGPNRIGQGIEFDYSCVHASFALRDAGYETIMVNCNPETVSTDYDTSDRLYFEPLTLEDVLEVVHAEQRSRRTVRRASSSSAGRPRSGLAQRLEAAGRAHRWAPARRRSTWPRTAAPFGQVLRRGRPARAPARHGRHLPERPRDRGRDRLPGAGPPVLRAGRPRHGDRLRRGGPGRLPRAGRGPRSRRRRTGRCSSTASSTTPSRSTSTRSTTAPSSTSAASWSTSRRPASTPGDSACVLPPITLGRRRDRRGPRGAPRRSPRVSACAGCSTCSSRSAADVLYVLEANPRAQPDGAVRLQGDRGAAGQGRRADHARRHHRRPAGRGHAARRGRRRATCPTTRRSRSRRPCCRSTASAPPTAAASTRCSARRCGPPARSWASTTTSAARFAKSQTAAYGGCPLKGRVFVSVANARQARHGLPGEAAGRPGLRDPGHRGHRRVCCGATASPARVVRKHSSGPGPDGEPTIVQQIHAGEVDMVVNTPSGRDRAGRRVRDPRRRHVRRQAVHHHGAAARGGGAGDRGAPPVRCGCARCRSTRTASAGPCRRRCRRRRSASRSPRRCPRQGSRRERALPARAAAAGRARHPPGRRGRDGRAPAHDAGRCRRAPPCCDSPHAGTPRRRTRCSPRTCWTGCTSRTPSASPPATTRTPPCTPRSRRISRPASSRWAPSPCGRRKAIPARGSSGCPAGTWSIAMGFPNSGAEAAVANLLATPGADRAAGGRTSAS